MTNQSLAKRGPVEVSAQAQPAAMSPVYLGSIAVPAHEVLDLGRKIATALADIIIKQALFVNVQGKKHVYVEGWTTMGAMIGVTPREVSSLPLDDGSYEAIVELVRVCDGLVIGRASAVCGAESPWNKREKYARKSMATTRATGKAFRLAFSWIMKLAGYEPTPAEEMPHGWGDSGSKEQAQAVAAEKLAQFGNPVDLPDDAPMADIMEDPLPPSDSPAATGSGSSTIKAGDVMVSGGTVGIATPAPRPAADPRHKNEDGTYGRYLYPEQAEHLKLFAKAKKAIGEEAYRRCLKYAGFDKSLHIDAAHHAERILKDMREIAAAQAKTRKLKSDQARAEMDAASLLPSREGSGCDMPISNQIATYVKALKWDLTTANQKIEMHRKAGEDWETIMLRLRELVEREAK